MNPFHSIARWSFALLIVLFFGSMPQLNAKQPSSDLPLDFVYLRDVAPTILQDMRYASANNFTGKKLPGYQASECILRAQVARALLQVQTNVEKNGYSLKVYDCYRPHRAVRAFALWARDHKHHSAKNYYPRIAKTTLFKRGYIAKRSTHSRGSTIDLTLVKLPAAPQPLFDPSTKRKACNDPDREHLDNGLNMGTAFDCFDVMSHTNHRAITGQARNNRHRLRNAMKRLGFANYRKEWWHYSYQKRKYPLTSHDFIIQPRTAQK
ncbi:MAG: M15 family metallopeptidase [bacterium]|nr:M15 family metallopeptidase [bacterium]